MWFVVGGFWTEGTRTHRKEARRGSVADEAAPKGGRTVKRRETGRGVRRSEMTTNEKGVSKERLFAYVKETTALAKEGSGRIRRGDEVGI